MNLDKLLQDAERELNELKAGRLRSAGTLTTARYGTTANFYTKTQVVMGYTYYYSARQAVITVEPTQASAQNFLANIAFEGAPPKLSPICYRRTNSSGDLQFVVDWTSDGASWQEQAGWRFDQTLVVTSTAPIKITLSYEENPPPYDE